MVYNTTYKNKDIKETIDDLMGKPFSLWQRFQLGGIGSSRMIIEEVSANFQKYINTTSDINYINCELRPNGILVHITKALEKFSWIIPYYRLSIFDSNTFSIHSQGEYIKIKKDNYYKLNEKFIKKLNYFKGIYLQSHFHQDLS